jgi:transposase
LALDVPAGKRSPLTPEQRAQLQQALQQPHGFGSYGEIQRWISTTFGVQLSYNAVHKLVRYKLRAKLKVPRPSHTKNPERVAAFCQDAAQRLQAVVPAQPSRPVKVWVFDESRFGLQTI